MGWFKNLRRARKDMKALEGEFMGGSALSMVQQLGAEAPGLIQEAGGQMPPSAAAILKGGASPFDMLHELAQEAPALIQQAGAGFQQLETSAQQVQQTKTTGVDATATIRGVRDTGSTVSVGGADNPIVDLDLDVHRPGQLDLRANVQTVVPRLAITRLTLGSTVPVKVDPLDPSRVAVVWS